MLTFLPEFFLGGCKCTKILNFSEQEPPSAMLQLHNIADNEEGWIQVVNSMIKVIPLADPLGPSVITLLLDDCPLPSKESIIKVLSSYKLIFCYKN